MGTAGNGTITGTPGDDVIFALGGHDTADGGPGTDLCLNATSTNCL